MSDSIQLKGAELAGRIRDEAAALVAGLRAANAHPMLAFVYPAGDGGAESYALSMKKSCEKVDIGYRAIPLRAPLNQVSLSGTLKALREDPDITGILLHSPLPKPLDEVESRLAVGPDHDVEGLHPENIGRWFLNGEAPLPCTAAAVLEILKAHDLELEGMNLVIVGRSPSVGKALAVLALKEKKAPTITICHTATVDLGAVTREADIVVMAAGKPGLLTGDMIREGAIIVDVGTSMVRQADGSEKLVGDVDVASVGPKCGAITPVPGGVGPVTAALLLRNVAAAAARLLA